ncbi:MAG: adenylate kinase [Anaerolineaceae bacterium]|nr:adenylate kinase [Anaerolineaceae bacterium]
MTTLADLGTRIVIVGSTGSGKSTLAGQLASQLDLPHIELDGLFWGPNWTETSPEVFIPKVEAALAGDRWVVDGNYSRVRHIVWPAAETIIWLDYSLPIIYWRLWKRTLRRTLGREQLWEAQNVERFWVQFVTKDSLFLWALKKHKERRILYPQVLGQPEHAHLQVLHFHHPSQTRDWLTHLTS